MTLPAGSAPAASSGDGGAGGPGGGMPPSGGGHSGGFGGPSGGSGGGGGGGGGGDRPPGDGDDPHKPTVDKDAKMKDEEDEDEEEEAAAPPPDGDVSTSVIATAENLAKTIMKAVAARMGSPGGDDGDGGDGLGGPDGPDADYVPGYGMRGDKTKSRHKIVYTVNAKEAEKVVIPAIPGNVNDLDKWKWSVVSALSSASGRPKEALAWVKNLDKKRSSCEAIG